MNRLRENIRRAVERQLEPGPFFLLIQFEKIFMDRQKRFSAFLQVHSASDLLFFFPEAFSFLCRLWSYQIHARFVKEKGEFVPPGKSPGFRGA
jgi:hypothetical protein